MTLAKAFSDRRRIQISKVEQNIGFHGAKEGEAGVRGGPIDEVGAGGRGITAFESGFGDDQVDDTYLINDILDSAVSGVG